MEDNLEALVQDLREIRKEPKKRIKWVCPVCSGNKLEKGKITQSFSDELDVEVTTSIGELEIDISKEDIILEQIKFPIRYCPWCGRKIRQSYKKLKN
jgi:rubrerythrin